MNYLIERLVKIKRDTEFKSLYAWCLNEFDKNGIQLGGDWVPSKCSYWFTGMSIHVSTKLNVKRDYESNISKATTSRFMHGKFYSGILLDGKNITDDVTFSILGTSRILNEFNVTISEIENGKDEFCVCTVIPSYEYEDDEFRKAIEDDYAGFEIYLHSEKFNELSKLIEHGSINSIRLSLGNIDGVYADWTPTGKVYSAKFLTAKNVIENVDDNEFKGTFITRVQELNITFTSQNVLKLK